MKDPTVIGERYIVETLISQGMMGPLYRGRDDQQNQLVAIKVLQPELLDEHPTLLERFLREGEALRQLDHPNIVNWLNVVEQDGVHYLIMEFVEGGSLYKLLRQTPQLTLERTLEIGLDLADALTRAHRLGIIHRDLKPQNVLLSEDGSPRLSDFGIAHYVRRTTLSKPGGFAGTLAYIPPESFLGKEVDERTDIWSFGVMLFEMLAGRRPFESDRTGTLINMILNEPPPLLDHFRTDIPADLNRLVMLMLEKERSVRIQSIRLVGAALETIAKGQQIDLPAPSSATLRGSLPIRPTPFIGRRTEIAQIISLIRAPDTRLVTVSGPGGVGKTRLALRVAEALAGQYVDGIYFVDLAPITVPDLVSGRIARSLGLKEGLAHSPEESIIDHLRGRRCLLILDNFEQIIEAAGMVGELIAGLPGLDVLVTSREVLRLYGEQEFPVPPLSIPDSGGRQSDLAGYESVALFVRHAQLSNPNFRLTEENALDVAAICIRLDGLPLAIELAAARTKALPPRYLRQMIEDSLDTLSGGSRDLAPRHQTIRGTINWSYDLLAEEEKRLFGRLAVFHGGRSLNAIQSVCQPGLSLDAVSGVESLINKSLLRRVDGVENEPRYIFLETIHQYAVELLRNQGELALMQHRHAQYFAELAEQSEHELGGPNQELITDQLRQEHDNLRAALSWAIEGGDLEIGLRLAGALAEFWYFEGPILEGEQWIGRARLTLEKLDIESISPAIRAKVYNGAGIMAFAVGDHVNGKQWNQEALAISRREGDVHGQAWSLLWLSAHTTVEPESYQEGLDLVEEALLLFQAAKDQTGLAWTFNQIGELSRLIGKADEARAAYESALAISRETGNKRREAIALVNLSYVVQGLGDYQQAESYCLAGLSLLNELNLEYHSAIALSMLAGPLSSQGRSEQAATVLGAAEGIFDRMAVSLQPADRVEIDNYKAQTRERLGDEAFDSAWQTGHEMSLEQSLAYTFSAGTNQ